MVDFLANHEVDFWKLFNHLWAVIVQGVYTSVKGMIMQRPRMEMNVWRSVPFEPLSLNLWFSVFFLRRGRYDCLVAKTLLFGRSEAEVFKSDTIGKFPRVCLFVCLSVCHKFWLVIPLKRLTRIFKRIFRLIASKYASSSETGLIGREIVAQKILISRKWW